jgi:hypothetical protein
MGIDMQVKLLTARAGVDFSQSRGEIVEIPDGEAIRMIEAGQAEAMRGDATEKAVSRASGKAERAVK